MVHDFQWHKLFRSANKAGKHEVFCKVVTLKAKPASTVVKVFCVVALKKSI